MGLFICIGVFNFYCVGLVRINGSAKTPLLCSSLGFSTFIFFGRKAFQLLLRVGLVRINGLSTTPLLCSS